MNERIKQLLKQARSITAENHVPGGSDYEREIYVTFAELIVRECSQVAFIDWCEGTNESSSEMPILKHFGMK